MSFRNGPPVLSSPDRAVHFGNELPTALLVMACRVLGMGHLRWVWHQRQQIRDPEGWTQSHFSRIRLLSCLVDRVVTLYEGGRESLIRRRVASKKVRVVLNGMPAYADTERLGGTWLQEELGVPPHTRLVANVSSLIERKRVDLTIRAFARHVQQGGREHLVLVGSGSLNMDLKRLAAELDVASRIHFVGRRNDVRDVLAACSVLMLTSTAEACPWAIIEAMSVGVPAVVTEAGAARELVDEGSTGYVVSPGDVEGLAERLGRLFRDSDLLAKMSSNAQSRWRDHFTLARMVGQHLEEYRMPVERPRSPTCAV